MCDKKNKVLFTDTKCLVLSPDFKLPDENQVLLRVPRQHNMYNFNLENIISSGGLACLIVNAIVDESTKWHRRMTILVLLVTKERNTRPPAEAVSTACYVLNRVLVTKPQNKTPYELLTENKANKTIGPKETNNSVGTQDSFDAGNSEMEADHAQEYYVLPLWSTYTSTVKSSKAKNRDEKLNEDTDSKTNEEPIDQEDQAFLKELKRLERQEKEANNAAETLKKAFAQSTEDLLLQAGTAKASSTNYVNTTSTPVNVASTPLNTASTLTNQYDSQIPSLEDIFEVLKDGIFTSASYDDEGVVADFTNLETTMNDSPILTSRIHSIHLTIQILGDPTLAVTGTKWVYKNKKDKRGVVVRNKARLVAQGHRQEEGIDYDEMDVKSAFLYCKINEEVCVSQPLCFIDHKFPNKVYKVVKALYGLHQAPRAWYATLSTFLVQSGYRRGLIDKTIFIKKDKKDIMLVQVYVDDIIFCSTKKSWCDEFENLMKNMFQMSFMGELTFFLGLQVKQKEDGIFISQDKHVAEIMKKFDFLSVKTASTPIETKKPLVKDEEAVDVDVYLYRSMIGSLMYLTTSRPDIIESDFDLEAYSDSDYDGANLDRKSTTGGCQFLDRRLISWKCKKQTIIATSTTEAEYVVTASCCGQVL
nr:retrovirus-related Pol polyprotein from transposon TNT 1-94 [Tanacetum cinerariifolium]